MRRFIAARVAHAAIVVAVVTTIAFLLLRLAPGDPFSYDDPSIPESVRQRWRVAFGYDKPVAEQYVRYLGSIARGDFGFSVHQNRTVREVIAAAAPRTLSLAIVSIALATILGTALGAFSATKRRSLTDRSITAASVFVYSIPEFWLALMLQMGLGFGLGLFPISGMSDPLKADYGTAGEILLDRLWHFALPALTLTLLITVILARYQRATLIDVLPSDYLRTARAKGASERTVIARHALRNALIPTITMLGLLVPSVLGGIYFIEYVFDWPGLGRLAVSSVQNLDYDVATASVIIAGVLVAGGSLAADVAVAIADPRVRDG